MSGPPIPPSPAVGFSTLSLGPFAAAVPCAQVSRSMNAEASRRGCLPEAFDQHVDSEALEGHGRKPARVGRTPWSAAGPPASPSEVRRKLPHPAGFHRLWWPAGPCRQVGRGTLWVRWMVNPPFAQLLRLLALGRSRKSRRNQSMLTPKKNQRHDRWRYRERQA